MKLRLTVLFPLLIVCGALAQVNANPGPVSYTSISELNTLIGNLQSVSQSLQQDVSHLRVDKWKTDSSTKKQTQNDLDSILRNLQNALPGILADLRNSPENLALTFKTYRNLDALYDVLNSVAESAGAFGSKDDYQSLSNDLGAVENSRRGFAERMDKLALSKDAEIGQLRTQLQNARSQAAPPKKVIVDDEEPSPKKPAVKKKPVPKSKAPSANQPVANPPK